MSSDIPKKNNYIITPCFNRHPEADFKSSINPPPPKKNGIPFFSRHIDANFEHSESVREDYSNSIS